MNKTITTSLAVLTSAITSLAFATPTGSLEAQLKIEICKGSTESNKKDLIIRRLSFAINDLNKLRARNKDSNPSANESLKEISSRLEQSLSGIDKVDFSGGVYTVTEFCEGKLYIPAPPKTLDQVVSKMTMKLCSREMNQSDGADIIIRAIEKIDVMRGGLRPGHSERIPMDKERDFLSDAYDGLMTSKNYNVNQVCNGVRYVAPPVKSKTLSELESEMKGQLCSKGSVDRVEAITIIGNTLAKIDVLSTSYLFSQPERTRLDAKRHSLSKTQRRLADEPGYTLSKFCQELPDTSKSAQKLTWPQIKNNLMKETCDSTEQVTDLSVMAEISLAVTALEDTLSTLTHNSVEKIGLSQKRDFLNEARNKLIKARFKQAEYSAKQFCQDLETD